MEQRTLQILQLTDTHLSTDRSARLRGVQTDASLRSVLRHMARQAPPADLLLATGDLAHDASEEAYRRLARYLGELRTPVGWTPGNHDDPALMQRALVGPALSGPGTVRFGRWQVITLDSTLPGREEGWLGAAELARLEEALRGETHLYSLIALHHPPLPVGTPKMDAIALRNAQSLFEVIESQPGVRAVVWGHFHHASDEVRHGVRLMGTPSTCYQMKLGGAQVEIDDLPPGYRRLQLAADGTVSSEVVRAPARSSG